MKKIEYSALLFSLVIGVFSIESTAFAQINTASSFSARLENGVVVDFTAASATGGSNAFAGARIQGNTLESVAFGTDGQFSIDGRSFNPMGNETNSLGSIPNIDLDVLAIGDLIDSIQTISNPGVVPDS